MELNITRGKLNSNNLKVIAIIAMLIDHIAVAFISNENILGQGMHLLGRITMPIICFLVAEGYYKTKNLRKYMLRLFIFAIISHVFFYYFATGIAPIDLSNGKVNISLPTSVILSLFLGLVSLAIFKNRKINLLIRVILIICICFISVFADWGYIGVLWILFFGIYNASFTKQIISFSVIGIIFILTNANNQVYQFGIFLSIPLLAMYSGELGKIRNMKLIFYIFYPLHLFILGILRW